MLDQPNFAPQIPDLKMLLGGRSADEFLREYWQKKPCLIKNAWPLQTSPLTGDELAGLACEVESAARIVQERHSDGPWQVSYGPFEDSDFAALPDSHWTLLVTDCEKYLPELKQFIQPFRFLPDWRIDDLMISYAADQGSVGPHVDEYDVFLLQLEGQREWRIGGFAEPKDCIPGLQLRILKQFHAEQTHLLNQGDMLYLPPRLAHYGIARGTCMTASIGFRAPETKDLLHAWVDNLVERISDNVPLHCMETQTQNNPAEISAAAIATFQQEISQRLAPQGEAFQRWLGEYLTEPNHPDAADYAHQPSDAELQRARTLLLHASAVLDKNSFSRFAWQQLGQEILFSVDALSWKLPLDCSADVQLICAAASVDLAQLKTLNLEVFRQCLVALMVADVLIPDCDD